ncbi:MAG: outer membrane protein transport protein [Leptospira sp.]|nr:outer membrane protein transport protein [Leptospira sp.]
MKPLVSIFLIILTVRIHAGSYGDSYGAHPRAQGMASAVTSFVNNCSAPFYNPAGLGRKNEQELREEKKNLAQTDPNNQTNVNQSNLGRSGFHEICLSYNHVTPIQQTSLERRERFANTKDHYGSFGVTLNLNEVYDFGRVVRFGFNILTPATGNLLTINDQNPNVARTLQSGAANERPTITGGLGIEVWKNHIFVGLGFTAFARGGGSILLKNVPISPDPTTPDQQVILQVKPIINPSLGIQFHYKNFDLGFSYRRETFLSVDPLASRAQTTLLGIQLDLDLALLDLYQPKVYSGGLSYLYLGKWRGAVDVNLEKWSEFKLSRTKLTYSEQIQVKDTTNVRVGLEYLWRDDTSFRVGYARRPSAIGDLSGRNNLLDFDKNIYTIGMSYALTENSGSWFRNLKKAIIFDLVFDFQSWSPRQINKSIPTESNPNYSFSGKAYHIGIGITTFL